MPTEAPIEVEVRLLPPLSNTARRERVKLTLKDGATVQEVIDAMVERFDDPKFRLHLYDDKGRLIPAWSVFIKGHSPIRLNSREGPNTPVADGDEVTFILNIAGG